MLSPCSSWVSWILMTYYCLILPPGASKGVLSRRRQGDRSPTLFWLPVGTWVVMGCVRAHSLDGCPSWSLCRGWDISYWHLPICAATVCSVGAGEGACEGAGEGDERLLLSPWLVQVPPGPRENLLESCLPRAFSQGIPWGSLQGKSIKFSSWRHYFVVFLV